MKVTEFTPGTIIKCLVNNIEPIYAIVPVEGAEINPTLWCEFSDAEDLFGINTEKEVCCYINGARNDYKEATLKEAFEVLNILNKDPEVQSFVSRPVYSSDDEVIAINIDPSTIVYKGHKAYTRRFTPDEPVLIKSHSSQEWSLAHYSHCTSNNIHIVQPGVPVREIIPYKGNEKLLGKK